MKENNENIDNNVNIDNNENIDNKIINIKKIIIFGEKLEYINSNEIENLTRKINTMSFNTSMDDSNEAKSIFLQRGNHNFPIYNNSFKGSLHSFIRENKNKEVNNLYQLILKEIKKIYYAYTHVEQKMYNKMNYFIRFKEAKNNTPLQIVSKLKEIKETIKETIKFIEVYLTINLNYLKTIFSKTDKNLSHNLGVKSVSLYFLLDIFDLPNNELSYILMFKVIDEISCILRYITDSLDKYIRDETDKSSMQINNKINNNKDNQSNLIDDQALNLSAMYNETVKMKNQYVKEIYELLDRLDEYNSFRAKYYNKYLYTRGNFQVDTNRYLYYDYDENDIIDEIFQINSLMDEEVIINKFLDRELINEFLNYFHSQLSTKFKRNENLIYLHSIYYNALSIIVIYSFLNYKNCFIEISLFFIGKIIGKILYNYIFKKGTRMKTLLIISNAIILTALLILIFNNLENKSNEPFYIIVNCLAKFLIGSSYCKSIETKFILNYMPKLLIRRNIKKYFRIKYLSIAIGFFFISGLSYLYRIIHFDNEIKINAGAMCVISFAIIIIYTLLFNEPKIEDIADIDINNSNVKIKELILVDKGNDEVENIINSSVDSKLNTSDNVNNLSYGKAKFISYKERNKVKLLENSLKAVSENDNYEGTNHIFSTLRDLIIKQNSLRSSYSNRTLEGHISFLTILFMLFSVIIFYNPIINTFFKKGDNYSNVEEYQNKIWTFGVAYLLGFLSFKLKLFRQQKNLSSWNWIILLFLLFQIVFSLFFFISDTFIFENSPIFFGNYNYTIFISVILFLAIIIEKAYFKIMIREIPIEATICRINIDNYLDIHENIIKAIIFAIFYICSFIDIHSDINIKYSFIYKIVVLVLLLLGLMIFLISNFKRKQTALIKIINKVTYESF